MTIAEYRKETLRTLPDLGEILEPIYGAIDLDRAEKLIAEKIIASIPSDINKDSAEAIKLVKSHPYYNKSIAEIFKNISDKLNYSHMTKGLCGEIGELVECTGTELRLKNIDKVQLGEELGDIYWYLANYCNMRELDIPEEPEITVEEDMCLDLLIIKISNLDDIVKRFLAYNKPIERPKELEAVYDIRVALLLFEKTYSLNGGEIRTNNIAKLRKRFPKKFSDQLAVNRNLDEERKALEGNG